MPDQLTENVVEFDDVSAFATLCGPHDSQLRRLPEILDVKLLVRGNKVVLSGKDGQFARMVLEQLYALVVAGHVIGEGDVDRAIAVLKKNPEETLKAVFDRSIVLGNGVGMVRPRTPHQREYVMGLQKNDIMFAIGPAGTGKTWLAMAMAIGALASKSVKTIVLTRPAVEAGERLGFLPGDLVEKVNPYLRPLYDAMYDLVDQDRANRMMERGQIEIAPLAFMRGRTLSNAFLILDEAQNTTVEQMKMFLTRLGPNSRAVVTGDVTQVDLPAGRASGLVHARRVLSGVNGIGFVHFDSSDVQRHRLVHAIIEAYQADGAPRDGF